MSKAIYPGTFDPITKGHIDIARRALKLFGSLTLAVADNIPKVTRFDTSMRVSLAKQSLIESGIDISKIEVISFAGLLTDFAKNSGANVLVRGLRAVSDFEYEFQMAGMNSRLADDVQTIFIPASEGNHFVASSIVKEVARLGGDISEFVTPAVQKALSS